MSKYYAAVPAGFSDEDSDEFYDCDDEIDEDKFWDKFKNRPSIGKGAGLNGVDFEDELNDENKKMFHNFYSQWTESAKAPELLEKIESALTDSPNPFVLALQLFANAKQYSKADSLSLTFLEALKNVKTKMEQNVIALCLDNNTKVVALHFVCNKSLSTIKLVVETFELVKSKDLFIEDIRSCIDKRLYKEASRLATQLDLCDDFTLEDIFVPLFLEDRVSYYEEYFAKTKSSRTEIIKFLDSLIDSQENVLEKCEPLILKFPSLKVCKDKLVRKSIHKLIRRWMAKYKIDKSLAPNDETYHKSRQLSFIIKHHYEAKKASRQSFEENVREHVKEDVHLQLQLIQQCIEFNKFQDATMFMKEFKVDIKDVPKSLRDYINNGEKVFKKMKINPHDDVQSTDEEIVEEEKFYELSLPESRIKIVNSPGGVLKMLLAMNDDVIGFDTENTTQGAAAILQLATKDAVYIVDLLALQNVNVLKLLGSEIFNNEKLIKIGFDNAKDIEVLQKSLGINIKDSPSGYRDLKVLSEKALEHPSFRFPFHEAFVKTLSLSKLTKLCFGHALDKGNQLSNWSQRPLRQEQLTYAALDAFVLLEIYEIMK